MVSGIDERLTITTLTLPKSARQATGEGAYSLSTSALPQLLNKLALPGTACWQGSHFLSSPPGGAVWKAGRSAQFPQELPAIVGVPVRHPDVSEYDFSLGVQNECGRNAVAGEHGRGCFIGHVDRERVAVLGEKTLDD